MCSSNKINYLASYYFQQQVSSSKAPKSGNDALDKITAMGEEPDRRYFLERLFAFMDEKGTPITVVPAISKQPVDLYKLYHLVKERGGMVDVSRLHLIVFNITSKIDIHVFLVENDMYQSYSLQKKCSRPVIM